MSSKPFQIVRNGNTILKIYTEHQILFYRSSIESILS
jgi:hypothetical protein